LLGPFAAILMERFGLRKVMMTALTLVTSGLVLATQMRQLWHLVLLWGVLLGVGAGMTALVLNAVVSNRWFETHRGLVVGILTARAARGRWVSCPGPPGLPEHFGWRMAVLPLFLAAAVVVLLVSRLMRNRPNELGLVPFGAAPGTPVAPAAAPMAVSVRTPFQ